MPGKHLIIGITGVTCGGKTTLSKKLVETIRKNAKHSKFNISVKVVSQDDYFLDVDDKRHVWIEEIEHIHFDVITSLDMDQMYQDVLKIISTDTQNNERDIVLPQKDSNQENGADIIPFIIGLKSDVNILILEGFSIFEHEEIYKLCDLKYFFTLDYEECKRRRMLRVYEPPDCEGYFDVCVWPEYLKYIKFVQGKNDEKLRFFVSDDEDHSAQVFKDVAQYFE